MPCREASGLQVMSTPAPQMHLCCASVQCICCAPDAFLYCSRCSLPDVVLLCTAPDIARSNTQILSASVYYSSAPIVSASLPARTGYSPCTGVLLESALAWAIIPTQGWRCVLVVSAIPLALLFVVHWFLLPESARYELQNYY